MDENLDLSKNAEINEALKEFEEKSQAEQVQKAPEVLEISNTPKIVGLAMKWFKLGQKQAEYTLLGFVILAMAVSLFLFFGTGVQKEIQRPPASMTGGTRNN